MEWTEKLQIITDYVENHLQCTEEPLNYEEISRISGCSFDFFQKVFSYMNGISFSEYVRLRKLTLAGYDLKSTDMKIVDISYKYGYNPPTSFTKAFEHFHGVSPREARKPDIQLCVMPKMQPLQKEQYSWRLEKKPALHLTGKSTKISCVRNEHYQKIPAFWNECQKNGIYSALISIDAGSPKGLFGLFGDFDSHTNEMEYSIMTISDRIPSPAPAIPGFSQITIPEAMWAVFDCIGAVPRAIQKGWGYLHEEWLIKYPFKLAPYPELEWYSDGNVYSEDYLSQIWIPILEEDL